MIQTVYKICWATGWAGRAVFEAGAAGQRFWSLYAPPPYRREYVIGRQTFPEAISKLYAFESIIMADFWGISQEEIMFECEADVEAITFPMYLRFLSGRSKAVPSYHRDEFIRFWVKDNIPGASMYTNALPGSVLCRWIRPLRIVRWEEINEARKKGGWGMRG